MTQLLIIGGSDAGISAALRAKELDPAVKISMVVADRFPNFSICGLPFYLSGEVRNWQNLAHRTKAEIEEQGIHLLLNHSAEEIIAGNKTVRVKDPDGRPLELKYDKLVIATGAVSARPDIRGIELPEVFSLRWMSDSFALQQHLENNEPRSVAIVGGGYIGMEMADAFTYRGLNVSVVEFASSVLTTVDPDFSQEISAELKRNGVQVFNGVSVREITRPGSKLMIKGSEAFKLSADLVLVAAGCKPNSDLAVATGIKTGNRGAIKVNRKMETNIEDIYAAGDCVETWHNLLEENMYLPLGTTAHKQGRIAGENAIGGDRDFPGSLGTQVVKIFDTVVARTGLRDEEASRAGFDPLSVDQEAWDHKIYYPGAKKMRIRITGDRNSKQLLGAQMIGSYQTEVSKRIDVFATALFHRMKVEDLNDLDLSYTPPLSSPWDPIQMGAQAWIKYLLSDEVS
jgi:NADPH-dependent 2,4-dienoyl-CoA reductase/sulfur reductase-like enzyme